MKVKLVNKVPEVWCWSCKDYGVIELFHPSTDGLIGHRKCHRIHGRVYREFEYKMTKAEIEARKSDWRFNPPF